MGVRLGLRVPLILFVACSLVDKRLLIPELSHLGILLSYTLRLLVFAFIMSAVTAHLMRRSVELASDHLPSKPEDEQTPGGLVALFIFSALVFALIGGAVSFHPC